jgi:aldehyde:ferredoxin oxidoreductase
MKIIRVNMTDRTLHVEETPASYTGLGGRGLTSTMINAEVPPRCDALGPGEQADHRPRTAQRHLAGQHQPNLHRRQKPLDRHHQGEQFGRQAGRLPGKAGNHGPRVEGSAPEGELHLLTIDAQGKAQLQDASDCKGMRTYALCAKLMEAHGPKNTIMCIGPAGEYRLGSASIQTTDVDDRPSRAAGRGGLGAVMGAKGLKAVVVSTEGNQADALGDVETFKESAKTFAQALRDNPFTGKVLPRFGTASAPGGGQLPGGVSELQCHPGRFRGWEKISGESLAKLIQQRGGKTQHMGCAQCIVQCSNEFVDENGKYVTSALEYETIWAMGGMLGIDDLDTIARLDFLCDDIGLDTMNTGWRVAVAMDAGHKPFGDGAGRHRHGRADRAGHATGH